MKGHANKIKQFFGTVPGIVILFILIFYVMTFSVYWFYSPGPEERNQTEAAMSTAPSSADVPHSSN
jgi:hypothetical protein